MVFVPHYRLTFSGILGPVVDQSEIWSFGMSLARGSLGTAPGVGALTDDATAFSQHFELIKGRLSGAVNLTRTRIAAIGADGKYERTSAGQYLNGDSQRTSSGTATGTSPWPQSALAVTLNSVMDDLTGRGRFFLPMPVVTMGADLRIDTANQTAIRTLMKSFLDAINTTAATRPSDYGRVCIASQGSPSRGIAPANRPVVQVGVGRVMDTIRSRRGELLEEHTYVTLA